MGKILEEHISTIKNFREVIPNKIYEYLISADLNSYRLEPSTYDRKKYFIEEYEELSQSIFELLHYGNSYYILGYVNDFNINRLSAGFNNIEELVHYSVWVIENYYKNTVKTFEFWNELKEMDINKSHDEILISTTICFNLEKELAEVSFNIKNENDIIQRLALIKVLEQRKNLTYEILSSFRFYYIIDNINSALDKISDLNALNKVPDPLNQPKRELTKVTYNKSNYIMFNPEKI